MKIEQIDKDLYTCNLSDEKELQGMKISYSVDTFGTSKDITEERILIAMIELLLTVEDVIERLEHE